MQKAPHFESRFLGPKFWPMWLLICLLYLISWLPYRVLIGLGQLLGKLLYRVLGSRRKIAERNIELCFPEKTPKEVTTLTQQNFEEMGIAMFEVAIGWWWPAWRVKRLAHYEGFEHIERAFEQGKGVLLLASHQLHLEAACRVFGLKVPSVGFYRQHDNPLMEYFQYHGRAKSNKYMLDKFNVKGLIEALNQKEVCFYLPDQDYGPRRCQFVPFFAVQETASTTGTLMFAEEGNCETIAVFTSRLPNAKGYKIEVLPAFDNFPSGDDANDVRRVNAWVEQAVMRHPEQYMWVHRRFKTRPKGQSSLY
ncbi:LpxL/LpxP family Kdo(2)-lipid IV(A) lauroyl/palmitoleoyl acyltransferase [Algicola sagamiensis]|uniref:LpxL/LpxP family Kdo(2)-lipid IV(A) lauroyl/palmitoleoyl acyltransferase n=1 Tax=Algicola sagamiensis TaxID=163869 RepID=UPI00047674B0|nr:LpxL/LpxP family Kdo(2)-lipid IV(A) lauroyl/palmitoleoyl acyltransferase [Algicola sagamiensis]